MKKIALAALFALGCSAHAAGVKLLTPVVYAPGAPVEPKVRDVCRPDERMALDVAGALSGSTESTAGEVVRVSIVGVGGGDGNWSGPRAISIHVELLKDGQPARRTDITRTTDGGVFGDFRHVCSLLQDDSVRLGKAVAKWLAGSR